MKRLYLILPLALILCFMVSCQDKEAMAELEEMKAQAEIEEQNKAMVLRWLEEMDKGNLAIFDEFCTEDYKFHYPSSAQPLNREQYLQVIKAIHVAFPDYNHTVEDVIAKDDRVVVRATNRGTHKGKFGAMPATGKEFQFSVMSIVRCVDGKAAEVWADGDQLGFYQQLGMELKPKEGEK